MRGRKPETVALIGAVRQRVPSFDPHQGQKLQYERTTAQPQDGHVSAGEAIFHFRCTFRRHQGQYRMNRMSSFREQRALEQRAS